MAQIAGTVTDERKVVAQRFPAMLYGVVAILTAELAVQPGEFDYLEAALGALLVGAAMMITRIVVEIVKKEAETGTHIHVSKAGAIIGDSTLVMVFPALTAVLILGGAVFMTGWQVILDGVLYLGAASIFLIGFASRYTLDREWAPAALRGALWVAMCLVLVAAKWLAT